MLTCIPPRTTFTPLALNLAAISYALVERNVMTDMPTRSTSALKSISCTHSSSIFTSTSGGVYAAIVGILSFGNQNAFTSSGLYA